jgi:ribosomal protein S18 acetylase RimI-like enzyme
MVPDRTRVDAEMLEPKMTTKTPPMNTAAIFDADAHGTRDESVVIRSAVPGDGHGIAIVQTGVDGPYEQPFEQVVPLIEKDLSNIAEGLVFRHTWVAMAQEEIVGFCKCTCRELDPQNFPDLPAGWYLSGITVASTWRRRGISREMVRTRLDWLANQTDAVYYHTGLDNHASVALHHDFGFEEIHGNVLSPAPHGRTSVQRLFRLEFASN